MAATNDGAFLVEFFSKGSLEEPALAKIFVDGNDVGDAIFDYLNDKGVTLPTTFVPQSTSVRDTVESSPSPSPLPAQIQSPSGPPSCVKSVSSVESSVAGVKVDKIPVGEKSLVYCSYTSGIDAIFFHYDA